MGEGQTEGYLNLENETRQNEKYSLCEKRAMMASIRVDPFDQKYNGQSTPFLAWQQFSFEHWTKICQ